MTTKTPEGDTPVMGHAPLMRMAYTLNNTQPVRCTYVSDEPLFYIDAPIVDDESMSFDMDDDLFLALSEMDDAMLPASLDQPTAAAKDVDDLFNEQFGQKETQSPALDDTLAILNQSRMAKALLDFAAEQHVSIAVTPQIAPIFYDRMAGQITLRPGLSSSQQMIFLTRELRRVWQHRQGALIHPMLFHPDHAIVINRVQAADLAVSTIRIAWELRLAGQTALWQELDQNGQDDMTRAFAREAHADFRALNNGHAAAAAFETWFLSERCRSFDRTLIQQMLADYQSYVVRAGHADTSRVLTQQLLAALGAMPYGKNYLAGYAATILADPIFTDIRDRSNANFLWFIKFEQSFRATERDLQQKADTTSSVSACKDPSAHGSAAPAQILQLPVTTGYTGQRPARRHAPHGPVADIIDLDRWRRHARRSS